MRFVLLLIAAVVAIAAGVAALKMSGKTPPQKTAAVTAQAVQVQNPSSVVEVLVAREPVPVGTVIEESMIDRQPWPQHLVLENFIVSGAKNSDIVGKVARAPFQAREPFTTDKIANPNDPSFLAATLPTGMRAVTIATDAVSGVAGYVFPGDRINVLFTHNVPKIIRGTVNPMQFNPSQMADMGAMQSDKPGFSEILIPNALVLAVNVREIQGRSGMQATNAVPSSITLAVSDEQAQQLRLAEKNGTLSLALRSLKDKDNFDVPLPTMLKNLTHAQQEEPIRITR